MLKGLRQHQIESINATSQVNEGIIQLPTGSGKTRIEAALIIENLKNSYKWLKTQNIEATPVFVVLTPRILLTNQIYNEVKHFLLETQKDCQYLIVHSGRTKDDNNFKNWTLDLPYREIKSTTSSIEIRNQYNRAISENVPLVIFGTYDSAIKIVNAEIPVYMLLCDEAHHLVSEEFGWIPQENETNTIKQFNACRKYYFTATLKETAADTGIGMNNESLFGPILYKKTPLELIHAGEIIRPRMHLVDIANIDNAVNKSNELEYDVNAVIDSFTEHRVHCNIGAKLLIVTKGSKHLNDITTHRKMRNLLTVRPNLTIFDISSVHQPRINGNVVKREEFLQKLQNLSFTDEAIIFHINILTEGIDVPGITGIMLMQSLGLAKFLQTLGRASRLYKDDRERIYNGNLNPNELDMFIKPYAWIILPIYGVIGEDERQRIQDIVYALRETGFNASEDVVIKQERGSAIPQSLKSLNEKDTRAAKALVEFIQIQNIIEDKVKADTLAIEDYRLEECIKNMSDEELINF